jgi:hypothetical protein
MKGFSGMDCEKSVTLSESERVMVRIALLNRATECGRRARAAASDTNRIEWHREMDRTLDVWKKFQER